jgi:DNA-binding CsgD family transcriptional regulator
MAPVPVEIVVGLAFLGAGFLAWRRRPENRTGLLMVLAGIAWLGRNFARSDAELPTRIGELSMNLFLALVTHLVVVFPYGVIRGRFARALVWSAYTLAIGGYVLSEVVPGTNDALAALAIPLLLAVIFVVVRRWLDATPPARRALEPILWAGPPVLVVAALSVANDYLDIGSSAIDWLKLVFAAIPVAFLVGLLRMQLQRVAVGDLFTELSSDGSPSAVRNSLARFLDDPSLELAFHVGDRYVGADGKAVAPGVDGQAVTTVEDVALVHDPSLLQNPGLVQSAAAGARLALENARMHAELRARITDKPRPLAGLTTRELEVLTLIAEGRTDRGVAQALYVTPKTVEAHVRSIFRKLDLPTDSALENRRVHAVLTYLRAR